MKEITYHKEGDYLIPDLIMENSCLSDIENTANERIGLIVKKLAESENISEDLKSNNQLAWVQAMNNIKNRAEEIAYNEIIYI